MHERVKADHVQCVFQKKGEEEALVNTPIIFYFYLLFNQVNTVRFPDRKKTLVDGGYATV